jgi:cell division cycle 14
MRQDGTNPLYVLVDAASQLTISTSKNENLGVTFTRLRILVDGCLGFISGKKVELSELKTVLAPRGIALVSSELHNTYIPFANDFGPVNLGVVHHFCKSFSKRLAKDSSRVVVYCIEDTPEAQANASFLLGSFLILRYGWTPEQAAEPFVGASCPFKLRPFHDATLTEGGFGLSLLACLKGLHRSVQLDWFDWTTFDARHYSDVDNPNNGDLHQVCPKLIAFKGPLEQGSSYLQLEEVSMTPEFYVPLLLGLGVSSVVRLNEPDTYDPATFERAGIKHHDLFFNDCTLPPDATVRRFLDIVDAAPGAVAVHCRAGLGRTGTLIALWLMRRAGFSAAAAIGWLRIVRPGCVIGPQQKYLLACEQRPWHGNELGAAPTTDAAPPPTAAVAAPDQADGSTNNDDLAAAAELARQVTAGMCTRALAKAAALAAGPGQPLPAAAAAEPTPASLPPAHVLAPSSVRRRCSVHGCRLIPPPSPPLAPLSPGKAQRRRALTTSPDGRSRAAAAGGLSLPSAWPAGAGSDWARGRAVATGSEIAGAAGSDGV